MGMNYTLEQQVAFMNQIEYDLNTREIDPHKTNQDYDQTEFLSHLLTGVTLATSVTTVALFQKGKKDGLEYFLPRLVIGPDTREDHQRELPRNKRGEVANVDTGDWTSTSGDGVCGGG